MSHVVDITEIAPVQRTLRAERKRLEGMMASGQAALEVIRNLLMEYQVEHSELHRIQAALESGSATPAEASASLERRRPQAAAEPHWRRQRRITSLPFVVDRKRAGLPPPTGRQSRRCFWHVVPTGDLRRDSDTGYKLALKYLEHGAGPPLQWIVSDMPRELSTIEICFLSFIGRVAVTSGLARPVYEHGMRVMREFERNQR